MANKKLPTYDPNKPDKDQSMFALIFYWAQRGLSKQSLATKCDYTLEEFERALEHTRELRTAYEVGKAKFEEIRVDARHSVLIDQTVSKTARAKIALEDLRSKHEEWAPQTRAVRVQVQSEGKAFQFESLSEEEQQAVKDAHNNNDSAEENSTQED